MRVWNAGDTLYAADLNANFANPEFVTVEFRNSGNSRLIAYDIGASKLKYSVAGVAVFSVGDTGELGASFTATNSTTLRTLADRAADWVNVRDFGAVLNGTTSDTAAVAATYAATANNGSIFVPSGAWNATAPTFTAGKSVLWRLDKVTNGGGNLNNVVNGDVVEWYPGRKAFWKTVTDVTQPTYATTESQLNFNAAGGTFGGVASNLRSTVTVGTSTNNVFVWGLNSTLSTASVSSNVDSAAQHVATASTITRTAGNASVWGLFSQSIDSTGLSSASSGHMNGIEVDIFANGADDGQTNFGTRQLGQFVYAPYGAGSAPDIHVGLFVGPQGGVVANGRLGNGVQVLGNIYRAAFDASQIVPADSTVAAYRMAPGHVIDFSGNSTGVGSNLNVRTLGYVTADTALSYKKSGTTLWSVSDAGVMTASALATGGTTARTLAAIFADQNNVKSFGAVGDGTTVDLTALTTAPSPVYMPTGVFYTGATITGLPTGRWSAAGGGGQLKTLESGSVVSLGARDFAALKAAPATYTGYTDNNLSFGFNADFSKVLTVQGKYISGAATLQQPATGYVVNPYAGMGYFNMYNTSGWNQATASNDGRTNVAMQYFRLNHGGQGDAKVFYFSTYANGAKAGATQFGANPATGFMGGQVLAGANGVYLQPLGDFNMSDSGFDVAAIGLTMRAMRTNGTGALGVTWTMFRPVSGGTVAIDAFYSASGKSRIGYDLTAMNLVDLTGSASYGAFAVKANMKFFNNATNSDSTGYPAFTVLGTEWYEYDATLGHSFVVGSASVFNANANRVFVANSNTPPATNPTGGGYLYVDAGALKYRGSSGTVTTLAAA